MLLFYHNPLSTLCFFSLAMGIISLWIDKTPWFYVSFFIIAYLLGCEVGITSAMSSIPILVLGGCYLAYKHSKRIVRLLFFALISLLSLALSSHLIPYFHNWKILDATILSPSAYPYELWLNFDKPWIGIFPLIMTIPLLRSHRDAWEIAGPTFFLTLLGVVGILLLSLKMSLVNWDPKLPIFFLPWCVANLLFVTIPEEAFFRGFFQRELASWLGSGLFAKIGGIFGTSLFFTLLHAAWIPSIPFLVVVFCASVLYGTIYESTGAIESSIFCHFALNMCHFLFFTYPALQT